MSTIYFSALPLDYRQMKIKSTVMHMHTSVSPMHIPITVNILCKGTIDGLIYVFLAMSFIYLHELLTIS